MHTNCFALMNNIAECTKDFIVIFQGNDVCFTNGAFNTFFGVASTDEYKKNFAKFENHFVPHPSYFNATKIPENSTWIEAILELDEIDRVVSFLSRTHDPHAYSVKVNEEVEGFKIVTFTDITQTLIKRILIENHMNIDAASGAYTKQYFLHIKQSYEDAATFNEKRIGLSLIRLSSEDELEPETIKNFVEGLKNTTRDDDMLVRWGSEEFLLAYLVEDALKAQAVNDKLHNVLKKLSAGKFRYELTSVLQNENERISRLINRLTE